MTSEVFQIKVLLIGDHGIGKTSLAKTITEGSFPSVGALSETDAAQSSQENVLDGQCLKYRCKKETTVTAGDNRYVINIFDPNDEKAIKEYLPQVDICYMCFDISNPGTYDSISEKWLSSLKLRQKLILVGLKSDLAYDRTTCQELESKGLKVITQEVGRGLASMCKASHYVEVSALKYLGIEQLKDKTVFTFVENDSTLDVKERSRCVIM